MTEFWERCHFGLGGRICCVDEVTWMNTETEYKVKVQRVASLVALVSQLPVSWK